jgi:adenosylcobinamide-phosphate synthase
MSAAALAGGYVADAVLGDPARFHPVAGFGAVAARAERAVYKPSRGRGAIFAASLVLAAGVTGELAARRLGRRPVLAAALWASLGGRSLTRVAARIADRIEAGDLDAARELLPWLCGRDPQGLDADGLARAVVESVAENTSDAVVGALFWGAVAGPGGVLAHRAANTLDAMVGHRNDRYREFGWAAARLDDALNWAPARLAAALTVVCAGADAPRALATLRRDGGKHPSPNAGQVEAAFAGALGLRLGGPLSYGGEAEVRPTMGDGRPAAAPDVKRAVRLSWAVGASACAVLAGVRMVTR